MLSPAFGPPRRVALFWCIYLFLIWYLSSYSLPLLVLFVDVVIVVPFFIAQKISTASHVRVYTHAPVRPERSLRSPGCQLAGALWPRWRRLQRICYSH